MHKCRPLLTKVKTWQDGGSEVPDQIRQTTDAHVQSTGGETVGTQSAPSDGGKILVHTSDTQLRQLAEAISADLDRGATPSSSTEPDLTFDKKFR